MLLLILLHLLCLHRIIFAENEPYTGINWENVPGCNEDREENFFVLGCNRVFYRCHKGHPYKYECPKNLYFDPKRNRCNHKDQTSICLTEKFFRRTLVRSIKPFECSSREGSFEHPENRCDNVYYTCVHGRTIRQQCREDQVFDETRNQCDYKQNVRSCKGFGREKISGPISNDYYQLDTVRGTLVPTPPLTTSTVRPQTRNEETFCAGRPDGDYGSGDCSNIFWKCSNNKSYKYRCPKDLVYDIDAEVCMKKEDVMRCPNTHDLDALRRAFDCSGKVDGHYEKESCQPHFYSCIGGETTVLECTAGLVFDVRISACVYPDACRSALRSVEPPLMAGDHGSLNYGRVIPPSNRLDCSHGKQGPIAIQRCAQSFVQCRDGSAVFMNCPSGLVFDENGGYCDYPENCLRLARPNYSAVEATSDSETISYNQRRNRHQNSYS